MGLDGEEDSTAAMGTEHGFGREAWLMKKPGVRVYTGCFQAMLCCCRSVPKSCPTLCDGKPSPSVFHYLLEFAQIHVH